MIPNSFKTYSEPSAEHLAGQFRELTHIATPSLASGSLSFLKDYGAWLWDYARETEQVRRDCVFIPPNPSHGIVFPTGSECLQSACTLAQERGSTFDRIPEIAKRFSLEGQTLSQSIYTLSGGERALVALAKAYLLLPSAGAAVICNPARWLHPKKRHLIFETLNRCSNSAASAFFLQLDGETTSSRGSANGYWSSTEASVKWKLHCENPCVVFPEKEFPSPVPARRIAFASKNDEIVLESPTLFSGDNGVGKSTFAKAIAGLGSLDSGSVAVDVGGFRATPRLIFQEPGHQLFALAPREHLKRTFLFAEELGVSAEEEFVALQSRTVELLQAAGAEAYIGSDFSPNTLLQARLILAAERLVSGSRLLILDEPSWGLSSANAMALVNAVIERAHERGVAVAVISHEPEMLGPVFRSELAFQPLADGETVTVIHNEP